MTYLRELYPQGKDVTVHTVSAWHDLLADYPYEVAFEAAKNVARTWKYLTLPLPAAVIEQIDNILPEDDTPIELWRIAERQLKRATIMTQEDFESLPVPVQRYYGGVSGMRDIALLDIGELPNERARFLKHIVRIMEQEKARASLPPDVRQAIDGMVKKLEYKN